MFNSYYNPQLAVDRINNQISELEKLKSQIPQQPVQPTPTNLTQNFQIAPSNNSTIRYANSVEEVQKDFVIGDTPYFSKDMSVLWVKNTKGEIKSYELKEIVQKDEKDFQIEFLQAQIEELKKGMEENARTNYTNVDESVKSEESTNVSNGKPSKTKPKQSDRNV